MKKSFQATLAAPFVVAASASVLMLLGPESGESMDWTAFVQERQISTLVSAAVMLVLVPLCEFLNSSRRNKSNWEWLGTRRPNKPSSCEPCNEKQLLKHRYNSQSSWFLLSSAIYVMQNAEDADLASRLLGLNLALMAVFSFLWWSSRSQVAWILDNLQMEGIMAAEACIFPYKVFADKGDDESKNNVILAFLVYMVVRAMSLKYRSGDADFVFAFVAPFACASWAVWSSGTHGSGELMILALVLHIVGFVPKLGDMFDNFPMGTTLFHVLESMAYLTTFEWNKTLVSANVLS